VTLMVLIQRFVSIIVSLCVLFIAHALAQSDKVQTNYDPVVIGENTRINLGFAILITVTLINIGLQLFGRTFVHRYECSLRHQTIDDKVSEMSRILIKLDEKISKLDETVVRLDTSVNKRQRSEI